MSSVDTLVEPAKQGGVLLRIYVQPRASRNMICGTHGDSLKVAITAPPVDGKANKAVLQFFATLFSIPKREIVLRSGEHSRSKTLMFTSRSRADIKEQLLKHLDSSQEFQN